MYYTNIYNKVKEFMGIAENDIKFFQKTRNEIDSYKRVLRSIINKKIHEQGVQELEIAYDRLSKSNRLFTNFYEQNKQVFSIDAKRHIGSYLDYLKSAVSTAEKRLVFQRLIRDIKVYRSKKVKKIDIRKMFDDLNDMYEECRLKGDKANTIAEEIKAA